MLPQREFSRLQVVTGGAGSDAPRAAQDALEARSAAIETNTYFHRPAPQFEVDEVWLTAASGYEDAMAQLVLGQPGAVERVRAASQALQALTVAQAAGFGPDDIAA